MKSIYLFLVLIIAVCYAPSVSAQCPGQIEAQLTIVPDNYGSETTWEFTGPGGSPIYASGGPYTDGNTTPINVSVCLDSNVMVVFTIFDGYGDGICCTYGNGSYTVTIDGNTVASGGSFAASESTVVLGTPQAFDCMLQVIASPYPLVSSAESATVSGSLMNLGSNAVSEISLSYQAGSEPVVTESFSPASIPTFEKYSFTFTTTWTPLSTGPQTVRVWVNSINMGNADMNNINDTANTTLDVYQATTIPNRTSDFLAAPPVHSNILTSANQLDKPTDLDFHSILSRKELWVLNENTENSGGSTVTVSDAGLPTQTDVWKRDGNAWHFMSLSTGLAFGTNGNFATSPGVYDANHNGGAPFTGPSLWSSDMSIYAQNAGPGTNGSHLDMLHESPYSMGIAHHKDNAYWVFDGDAGNIVYYDFVQDHGPGQSYHGDAIIRRYSSVSVLKDNDVPSHLELDKATGWLYIVDNGNDRVLRMNTNTGTVQGPLTGNEPVEEYSQMTGVVSELVVDTGLTRPSGIDIVEDRMIVGDYATGNIRFYDISVNPAIYLGKIATGAPGLTGITFGPEGNIWYANRLTNEVGKITPSVATGINNTEAEAQISVFPSPATTQINIRIPASFDGTTNLQVVDALGREVIATTMNTSTQTLNCSEWAAGVYMIKVQHKDDVITKSVRVQ